MIKIFKLNSVFLILIFILLSFLINSCSNSNVLEKKNVEFSDLVLLKKNRKFSKVAEALNLQNPLFDVMSANGQEFEYKGVKYNRLKLFVKVGESWISQKDYFSVRSSSKLNEFNDNYIITIIKSNDIITYNVICDTNGLIVDWFTILEAKNGNTDFEYELIKKYID